MPSLAGYDVLGFDADCCIVKYNNFELMKSIASVFAKDLHLNGGYPAEIEDITDQNYQICLNALVWDIPRGNLLRLGEGKLIKEACHGFKRLSSEEIESCYGSPALFTQLNYPAQIRRLEGSGNDYDCLISYFNCCYAALVAKAIELID